MSKFVIMDDAVLRRVADIIGPNSAAARALTEAERQRADGVDAVVCSAGRSFNVCSRRFAEMRAASVDRSPKGEDAEERLDAEHESAVATPDAHNQVSPSSIQDNQ